MTQQHAHQRRPARTNGEQPAPVLVVFGITGDLAEGDDVPVAVPAGAGRPALVVRS